MQIWVSSQSRHCRVLTLYYGVVKYLKVLCVGVCFFLRTKARLQHCVTSVIKDVICVSHGEVFTVFHPDIMLHYYTVCLYAVVVWIVVVYVLALVQGLVGFPLGYYGIYSSKYEAQGFEHYEQQATSYYLDIVQ